MIELHCDICGQIIDTKQRYYCLDAKGPNGVFEPSLDVCSNCIIVLKNLKERDDAN